VIRWPWPRRRMMVLAVSGAAAAAAAVLAVSAAGLAGGPGPGSPHPPARGSRPPASRAPSVPHPGFTPVAPATISPSDDPVQQEYDQAFERGFSSAANKRRYAAVAHLAVPPPGITGGWPALPVASDPGTWAEEFARGLLDIRFARQSRAGLGRWLVAQSALDLMPGVPAGAAGKMLYASVLDPAAVGGRPLVPSPAAWRADAAAGVTWSVSHLDVQIDPAWQQMIDAGWQPEDLRAVVEDVTGVLAVSGGPHPGRHAFELVLSLGSARWHGGYGTAIAEEVKG
jgi:hypothetical protein